MSCCEQSVSTVPRKRLKIKARIRNGRFQVRVWRANQPIWRNVAVKNMPAVEMDWLVLLT